MNINYHALKQSLAAFTAVGLLTFTGVASAAPSWSMDMAYEDRAGNDRVFVANPDQDTVSVIDAVNGNRITEVAVGDDPRSVALDGNGFLWVVNKNGPSISIIDTTTLTVANTIPGPIGSRPHGIVIDTDNDRAYLVLEASGLVMQLDTTNGALLATANVGLNPREISINDAGTTVYLPRFITSPVAGESGLNPANGGGEVIMLSTNGLSAAGSITIPFNQAANGTDNNTSARGLPNYLRSMAISPNGANAFLPAKIDNIHRGTMRDGQARGFNIWTRGIVANINLNNNTENLGNRIEFANNSAPTAVAYGPNGNTIYVVHRGSRAFEAINANNGNILFETTLEFAPTGVIASPDGNRVFVHNWLSRSLSIIDTSAITAGGNAASVINTVDLTAGEALSAQVLQGKQLFHDSADPRLSGDRYISCAQCHDEGGHDGRTYDFTDVGEGLRNTTEMRGRGNMEDGLVHWTANFDEIQDFEHALRELFGGTGLMSNADFNATSTAIDPNGLKTGRSAPLDALVAFVDTLDDHGMSPFRQNNGALTAQAVAGRQVFEDYSCATCHSGTSFTNSPLGGSHNIGTVDAQTGGRFGQPLINGGLDTPTLQGLWNGGPYLHDGAALTVAAATQAHTQNMPVSLSAMTGAELADLSAYLLQIDDSEPAPADPSVPPGTPDVFSTLASINIDGNMGDWPADSMLVDDPQDSSNGAANQLDYETLWMANDAQNLYIRYRNHQPNNVQQTWGYEQAIDVDGPATGFRPPNNTIPIGVDFLIEQNAIYRYTGTGANWAWAWVATLSFELNGRDAELAIPRALLGNPDDFDFFFFADNSAIGGNAVDFVPNSTTNTSAPLDTRFFVYEFSGDSEPPVVDPPIDPPDNNDPFVFHNPVNALAVNGNLDDWAAFEFFPSDPNDVTGTGNQIDFLTAAAAHDANNFYIAWTNDGAAQVSWGNGVYVDADTNFNTGFRGFSNESPIGIDFLVEANSVYAYTGNGTSWAWQFVGNTNPVTAGNSMELQIPANLLGNPTTFDLFFYGDSSAIGGNGIDFYPNAVTDGNAAITARRLRYSTDATLAVSLVDDQLVNQLSGQE